MVPQVPRLDAIGCVCEQMLQSALPHTGRIVAEFQDRARRRVQVGRAPLGRQEISNRCRQITGQMSPFAVKVLELDRRQRRRIRSPECAERPRDFIGPLALGNDEVIQFGLPPNRLRYRPHQRLDEKRAHETGHVQNPGNRYIPGVHGCRRARRPHRSPRRSRGRSSGRI